MKKKRTKRERQINLSNKRRRHELRKKRKQKSQPPRTKKGDYTPHLEAMFRKSKKKNK